MLCTVPVRCLEAAARVPLVIALLVALACGSAPEFAGERDSRATTPGTLRLVEAVGTLRVGAVREIVRSAGLAGELSVEHGVSLYRLEYWTTGPTREPSYASGLMAVPMADSLRGVISFQHGTRTLRRRVPSAASRNNGLLLAAAFAGHGYLLLAPDYLGLGSSMDFHPYLHAESAANAVIDLLKAARQVAATRALVWPDALFLAGSSQGAHATLAAHRALEASLIEGLTVSASAPIAGAYNLSAIGVPFALQGGSASHSLYLGYLASAYARIYDEPLDSIISAPYAEELPRMFDGSHGPSQILAALPADPRRLFHPEFLHAFDSGEESWLSLALAENDVYDWSPRAPVRLYYGSRDIEVSPRDSRLAADRMTQLGADARAVNLGELDHAGSTLAAVPRLRNWFDQLLSAGRVAETSELTDPAASFRVEANRTTQEEKH